MTPENPPRRPLSASAQLAAPILVAGIPLALLGYFGTSQLMMSCIEAGGELSRAEVTRVARLAGGVAFLAAAILAAVALVLLRRTVVVPSRELEAVNRELRSARDEAVRAARFRASFLANMSHEIRTPLMGMLGMVEFLRESDLGPEQREYIETIHGGADTLLHIVNDVLDLSRIEMGDLRLEEIDFEITTLLEQSADLLRVEAARKDIELVTQVGSDVPGVLRGDPTRLRQVLTNLLSNAVKFTEDGRVELAARLARRAGDRAIVELSVTDSGMGIAGETLAKLFQPFTQAEASTARTHGGTGLGLSICKALVERMGGEISVESEPGSGSTFRFAIPLTEGLVPAMPEPAAPEPAPATPAPAIRPEPTAIAPAAPTPAPPERVAPPVDAPPAEAITGTVLLAEDNFINRSVAVRQLRKLGIEVVTAEDGVAAVRAVSDNDFDLILMDCQMPDMDGYQATERIRELEGEERHTPIIAVTAHAMESDRERCLDAGMDDYLAKPFSGSELKKMILRWIGDAG